MPIVVLDTNVVLDWLVFQDPACALLSERIEARSLRWIASPAMRVELAHVLTRDHQFDAWRPNESELWARWERLCMPMEQRALSGGALRLRCTDPDDQIFIDLATSHGARWLLSRDRAVLKLARRAAELGLRILTPVAWAGHAALGEA